MERNKLWCIDTQGAASWFSASLISSDKLGHLTPFQIYRFSKSDKI